MSYIIDTIFSLLAGAAIAAYILNKYHIDALKTESAHIKTELANLKSRLP